MYHNLMWRRSKVWINVINCLLVFSRLICNINGGKDSWKLTTFSRRKFGAVCLSTRCLTMHFWQDKLTWIRETSGWTIFLWKRDGISWRKIGIASERPSATACRTLPAIKNDNDRKMPEQTEQLQCVLLNSNDFIVVVDLLEKWIVSVLPYIFWWIRKIHLTWYVQVLMSLIIVVTFVKYATVH